MINQRIQGHFRIWLMLIAFGYLFYTTTAHAQDTMFPKSEFEGLRLTSTATVTEIVDPLTIRLHDGKTIRLISLDIPDLNFHDPGDLAVTAQKVLIDFLLNQDVKVYQTKSAKAGRKNRMGHDLAHIERKQDGTWIQGMLLSLGLARVRTQENNTELNEQMIALEQKARNSNQGLWSIGEYKLLSPENASEKIGSYQVIEGIVRKVGSNKNTLYLNFGANWRDDFTVSIDGTVMRKLTRSGLNPREWSGQKVRVRGWIESYNGPHIKLDHPERLEYLSSQKSNEAANPTKKIIPQKTKPGSALPALND